MSVLINASTSSGLVQTADTSGTLELQSNGTTKLTVSSTGAYGQLVSGTVAPSTSGTSIDFINIPSWAKRITVMFTGVSPAAAVNYIVVQLGTGGTPTYTSTGYNSQIITAAASAMTTTLVSNGFPAINPNSAANASSGTMVLTNLTSNTWSMTNSCADTSGTRMYVSAGSIALGAALTAVRITTADAFDAGSINILYEG